MNRLLRLGLIVWVLLPVVWPGAALAQETAADLPRFERVVCPSDLDTASECGFLVVPEDRSDPKRPAIRLAVVILKSRSATPAPDPIIYLEGGPGGSGTAAAATWADSPLRDSRDIILLDQRGTGLSKPSLNCPEIEAAQLATLGSDPRRPNTSMQAFEAFIDCHKRLLWEGINLAAYDSASSAADVGDLQRALGYPAVNLFGVSYGTRLALTVMRDHPDGVRSVVLDSVFPPSVSLTAHMIPNAMNAFERVFSACAEEAACHARYTDLEATLLSVITRLNAAPESVSLGSVGDVMLTGDRVLETLYLALYSPDYIRYVPYLIDRLNQGHDVPVGYLTRELLFFIQSISEGMNYSVQCREQDPFTNLADLTAAADEYPDLSRFILQQSTRAMCVIWDAGQAGEIESQPVVSDIPTLLLSGEYDPVTPPAWGQMAAQTLSHSYFYEFPGLAHGVTRSACPLHMAQAFLDDPTTAPDAGCMVDMPPLVFFVPG
jgi:pimeloyl-ACP methyl ester carboxylesterase